MATDIIETQDQDIEAIETQISLLTDGVQGLLKAQETDPGKPPVENFSWDQPEIEDVWATSSWNSETPPSELSSTSQSSIYRSDITWGPSINTGDSLSSTPPPTSPSFRRFRIMLLGDPSTGKTSYLQWLQTGTFSRKTMPSTQLEVVKLTLATSIGDIDLDLWNVPGDVSQTIFRHVDAFCVQSDGALIFFDVTQPVTYRLTVPSLYSVYCRVAEGPVVLVGSKVDRSDRRLKASDINFHRRKNLRYYEISVKANHNCTKPLLMLLRSLTAVADLTLLTLL